MTGKILLAAATVAALSSGAMAADLSIPAQPAPVVSAPAATNWDGPYIGATVGYGWSQLSDSNTAGFGTFNTNGWSLGAQLGYNFHLADQIVAGVQGNIDWNNYYNQFQDSSWSGAIVGRLGVDVDSILPYVEAGVAFANINDGYTNGTRTGWTAGAGVEFMLASQISANVEYRYSDYGTQDNVRATDNAIRVGLNYHF
ncbi:MAG TPA: outer membrane protein [Devosiaceae bacterium]|nr:outer membrane protein [Devosiaceae bacterium]